MQILLLLSLYSWLCYCKSFSSNATEVREVYTNVVYNFRDGLFLDVIIIKKIFIIGYLIYLALKW